MKEVKKYICEICHTEYSDKSVCAKCEQCHVTAREIVKERHLSLSMSQNGKGYPVSITVKMSDGTEKIYKRG